ncbi:FtsX-like permease family protein [Dactylosporangium sp. NPDC049140]|uniref:ABC transporter permease n=1 Tax=Dactylosporangium sp. NPDC049140 TaxID=3155647 RepID=UPI0033DB5261
MLRTTLAGLRARRWRMVATALAIVLGVGFVAGALVFGDTAKAALYDEYARAAQNIDLSVQPPPARGGEKSRVEPVLPTSTVDRLRSVAGIGVVVGRMSEPLPLLDRNGRLVTNFGQSGVALSGGDDPRLRGYDVTAGRPPAAAGEAALDEASAQRLRFAVGDRIVVLDTAQQRHELRLVGVVGFGAAKEYADRSVVVLTEADMTAIAGARGYREVVATVAGATPPDLLRRSRAVLPSDAVVQSGDERRHDIATNAVHEVDTFLTVLQIFAGIAVVVAAFVIGNTFNILIAQRLRELALLRCIGGSRGQVLASVLLEAAAVGLVGGIAGLALGLAVAYGMFSGANALGAALPSHALVLTATPVVVAVVVGLVVTVAAALVPAFRAGRVPPLAALRAVPSARVGSRGNRILLTVVVVLTAAAGVALTVRGEQSTDPKTGTLQVVAGGVVAFLAVVLLSPLYVGPLIAALGWLPGRILGTPARLATANARRSPGRTAATTAALMIGVGLMAGAVVLTATIQATATAQLVSHYPVDFILQPADTGQRDVSVPPGAVARLRADRLLGAVGEVRLDTATSNGSRTQLGSFDPAALRTLAAFPMAAGSLDDLRPGTVILFTGAPENRTHRLGDHIAVVSSAGKRLDLTVVGLIAGTARTGDTLVSWDDLTALRPAGGDDMVLIKAAAGVPPDASRNAVDADLADYPAVAVNSIASWRDEITSTVDQLIGVVAALLTFAMLIALIGIMNTMSLSVFERTRESALARALGLTRGQLRATLLYEACLMALVGALVGIGFGVTYGWLTARTMFATIQPLIRFPYGQLLVLLAVAALAAIVAAVLPARRAASASIVSAMAET